MPALTRGYLNLTCWEGHHPIAAGTEGGGSRKKMVLEGFRKTPKSPSSSGNL